MDNRVRHGYFQGILAIVVNTILFILKYWVGILSGSVALLADAWHTLSDSVSSALLILGIRLSAKKPDKKHPFGHGRYEQITAIFIGFVLGIIAWDFMMQAITKLRAHEAANFGTPAIVVTIIAMLMKEGLARVAFYLSKKTNNSAIRADGWHHRSDALSSLVLLIGILFHNVFWWIDGVLGIIIAIMLFYTTFTIVRDAVSKLLGEVPSDELIDEVCKIIRHNNEEDLFPHHFHIHNYGTHKELTFHIQVQPQMDVKDAHALATSITDALRKSLNVESTIHVEPKGTTH